MTSEFPWRRKRRTWSDLRYAAGTGAVAAALCCLTGGGLLYWLSLADAGNADLGEALGILSIFCIVNGLAASLGLIVIAFLMPGLHPVAAGVIGPVAAFLGFISIALPEWAADRMGLPRPEINELLTSITATVLFSVMLYFVLSQAWYRLREARKSAA